MKRSTAPPGIFQRFFCWFCRPKLRDAIEGDLLELYQERVRLKGKRRADLLFIIDVLLLLRPGIIRSVNPPTFPHQNNYAMLKNHFKSGWRRLIRNKGYAAINICGLAIGMTVAIFIGLWIYDELSYNHYHKNHETIAQLWSGETDPNTAAVNGGYSMQYPVAGVLRQDYPQYFKRVLLSGWIGSNTLATENNKFNRTGLFIEPGVAEMLSLKMLEGSYHSLNDPNSIILSLSTAIALYGNGDAINKTIRIDNKVDAKVTGVYQDIPRNNRFSEVQFFSPFALQIQYRPSIRERVSDWDNRAFNVYVQLQPGVSSDAASAVLKELYIKNVPPDLKKNVEKYKSFVQAVPMDTWWLYSEFIAGKPATGRIVFVWLFGIIGIFVLLLACINFINLSTARSEKRAREVGVRKALGSGKSQLVMQFLSESYLVVFLGFLVSAALVFFLTGWFNRLADKDVSLPITQPLFWLMALAFILFTGLAAGLYPAFILSSFQPVKVLKGVLKTGRLAALPRRVLVAVQFTVSVLLILGTVVVYRQIMFARDRPAGFDKSNLITISTRDPAYKEKQDIIKEELLRTGVVASMSSSNVPLTFISNVTGGYDWRGRKPGFDAEFHSVKITNDFGKTFGWQFVAGRDFSTDFARDTTDAVVINEAAAKYMGMKEPVGEKLIDIDGETGAVKKTWTIIGVIKDMVIGSPYDPAMQTIFYYNNGSPGQFHIRLNPDAGPARAVAAIQSVFEKIVPSALFQYKFVDEQYAAKFSQEMRIGKLAAIFAILSIFISCLGLSGLASYIAGQRSREIAIRKVLGASVPRLWHMLSADFMITVFVSCLIALPAGYLLMNNWLQKFQYRTAIPLWLLVTTALMAMLITLLTVSFQSVKAAMLNPVKSLRAE